MGYSFSCQPNLYTVFETKSFCERNFVFKFQASKIISEINDRVLYCLKFTKQFWNIKKIIHIICGVGMRDTCQFYKYFGILGLLKFFKFFNFYKVNKLYRHVLEIKQIFLTKLFILIQAAIANSIYFLISSV